jgi:glycosyltransferase involved in cell wall biosynthesis
MAAGKPVVVSKADGLSEIVQDGVSGLLVPPGDSKALTLAVLALLANPTKAASMGNLGRKVVGDFFSLVRFQSYVLAAFNHFV